MPALKRREQLYELLHAKKEASGAHPPVAAPHNCRDCGKHPQYTVPGCTTEVTHTKVHRIEKDTHQSREWETITLMKVIYTER